METPDLRFWFDPVCPFAWMTSKWVRTVAELRGYAVDWRFISLRMVNADLDSRQYPPERQAGHAAGLQLLRVAAKARSDHGSDAVARLYAAYGARLFEGSARVDLTEDRAARRTAEAALKDAGLPAGLLEALDDTALDLEISEETDEALALTGKDVGTPILQLAPPDGAAFFGPVISRLPEGEDALRLWDHVAALTAFPGFAELKRSLRETPQLPAFAGH
jgi:hypothetical protein